MKEEERRKEVKRAVKLRLEPLEKAPDSLYANFVQINHTPWDLTFHFGNLLFPTDIEVTGEALELEAKAVARVTVPTSLVKGVLRALEESISKYEASYGPLPDREKEEE